MSFDDLVEIFNQVGIYAANQNWKQNFWDTDRFLKDVRPKYVKWQAGWKNRIKFYTPRTSPAYDDVPVHGLIEKWNTKLGKGTSQIKTIPISPMFGPEIVTLYKNANDKHPAGTVVKSQEAAEDLRALVAMDIKYMIGCDQVWDPYVPGVAAGAGAAGAAAPSAIPLPPASASDDGPAPPAPPVDPSDFTKWDPLNVLSLPLPAQNYDAGNFRAQRSAHAGLLLCWMSPEVEAAFPTEAQALYAGFQELFQRDVTCEDVRRYPTVGRGAYTTDEADWCNATYDFLEKQLDDVQRAKRNLPAKKRVRRTAAAATAGTEVILQEGRRG